MFVRENSFAVFFSSFCWLFARIYLDANESDGGFITVKKRKRKKKKAKWKGEKNPINSGTVNKKNVYITPWMFTKQTWRVSLVLAVWLFFSVR